MAVYADRRDIWPILARKIAHIAVLSEKQFQSDHNGQMNEYSVT